MTKYINPLGDETTYAYDSQGRQTAVTNALSQTSYTEYDAYGKATKQTDALNNSTYYYYDYSPCTGCGGSQGQLTKMTDALGNDTFYYYDANSRMTKMKNALNQETDFAYDCLGRRVTTTFPSGSGNHMITEYDLLGLATKTIDLNGIATFNYYDERGRLTRATYPEIGDVYYGYDALGRKTKVTDALSQETEWFFDNTTLRLTKTEDALGKVLMYYYDSAGRVTKTGAGSTGDIMPTYNYYNAATGQMTKTRYTDAASNTADVEYFFNGAGQMTKLADWTSGSNELLYAYNDIGQLTKFTDYDSEELLYAYDAVGRVTSMTDYHGAATAYEYDNGGRLTTILAPGSKEWFFEYNDLGQPTLVLTPNGPPSKSSKLFQCNLPGATGSKLNPNALVETYGYDSRNRLTRRYLGTEATGGVDLEEFLYELDNAGNITKTTELDGTVWEYEYDDRYRLTLAEAGIGTKAKWKESYVYDGGDNLLTKKTPVQWNFDDYSRAGWNGASTYVVTKAYLERESGSLDAGICRQQAQNNFQAWFSYRHGGSSEGQVRLRESSGWMGVRITASTLTLWQSGGSTTLDTETIATDTDVWYEFYAKCDGANVEVWRREKGTADPMVKVLETASTTHTTGGWFTFASGAGNALDDLVFLKLDGDTLETETYAYNAANELTSQVINGTTLTFTYDQFGRMTRKTGGGKTADYYYHYGDKLTKVASNFGGEGTVTYTYGGDQKRRSRAVTGGDTTKYRYGAGWDVLNEEDGSGNLQATYIHHPGKQIGTVLATSEGTSASTGTWNYYFQDAIGSTRGLWDQDGDRIGKYEYTPFGGKYADHGEDITRKFTGHAWDSEARLYYTAYRYYSPDANRWLTRDPLGMVDGPNVYAYVVNNPVNFWDALGQWGVFSAGAAIGGIAGGLIGGYMSNWSWDGILYGAIAGAAGGALFSFLFRFLAGGLGASRTVSQWGGYGFESGTWVQLGSPNSLNWLLTGTFRRGLRGVPGFALGDGVSTTVAASRLGWPPLESLGPGAVASILRSLGLETAAAHVVRFGKGVIGQRQLLGLLALFGLLPAEAYASEIPCG